MKRLFLPLAIFFLSISVFAQKRNTDGLKKIEQPARDQQMGNLAELAELASLAELSSLSQLAELGELAELASLSALADADISIDISDITIDIADIAIDLQEEMEVMRIDLQELSELSDVSDFVDYGKIIEEVMNDVKIELKNIKDEQ